ncbi:Gfo/Idh/MocA family protein [Psychromarinibacter sp. S121]|uniref:Gfo/Idh/MocA family protein n=1 Tax=Psychromarinibacter sp. S121 TaxID=3415127 RepID=UPI003C7E71D3
MADLRVAVIGAGIIGGTHIATLGRSRGMALCCVVDPTEAGAAHAAERGVPHHADVEAMLAAGGADAAVVATPNHTHVPIATVLLKAGIPVLLEKPVANTVAEGEALRAVAEQTGVPLLVGHHRRHNPMVKAARAAISEGRFGTLVTANVQAVMAKPQAYFDVKWRTQPGAGGVMAINLIHEIDLLRHLFGEVSRVQGTISSAARGLEVEDSAAAILEFADGGIASVVTTDAGCGPWTYDLGSGESPRLPVHDIYAHSYAGTKAGMSLPDAAFWTHPGAPDWFQKMERGRLDFAPSDPFVGQMEHFGALARGEAEPLVSCADGIANMAVIEAIRSSAETGRPVSL